MVAFWELEEVCTATLSLILLKQKARLDGTTKKVSPELPPPHGVDGAMQMGMVDVTSTSHTSVPLSSFQY